MRCRLLRGARPRCGPSSVVARRTTVMPMTCITWEAPNSPRIWNGDRLFSRSWRAPPIQRSRVIAGRAQWMQRLEAVRPMILTSLAHQRRDPYWQHGSVCEDIGAIACPVMLVGGWSDPYHNAVFRLLRNLKTPRLGIVGPWGHNYPHISIPGPGHRLSVGDASMVDHWLKDMDTGIMNEPILRAYIQDWIAPAVTTTYGQGGGLARLPGRATI